MGLVARKPVFVDQRLCYSISGKDNTTCLMLNFMILTGFCSGAGLFEPSLVTNPEYMFLMLRPISPSTTHTPINSSNFLIYLYTSACKK